MCICYPPHFESLPLCHPVCHSSCSGVERYMTSQPLPFPVEYEPGMERTKILIEIAEKTGPSLHMGEIATLAIRFYKKGRWTVPRAIGPFRALEAPRSCPASGSVLYDHQGTRGKSCIIKVLFAREGVSVCVENTDPTGDPFQLMCLPFTAGY